MDEAAESKAYQEKLTKIKSVMHDKKNRFPTPGDSQNPAKCWDHFISLARDARNELSPDEKDSTTMLVHSQQLNSLIFSIAEKDMVIGLSDYHTNQDSPETNIKNEQAMKQWRETKSEKRPIKDIQQEFLDGTEKTNKMIAPEFKKAYKEANAAKVAKEKAETTKSEEDQEAATLAAEKAKEAAENLKTVAPRAEKMSGLAHMRVNASGPGAHNQEILEDKLGEHAFHYFAKKIGDAGTLSKTGGSLKDELLSDITPNSFEGILRSHEIKSYQYFTKKIWENQFLVWYEENRYNKTLPAYIFNLLIDPDHTTRKYESEDGKEFFPAALPSKGYSYLSDKILTEGSSSTATSDSWNENQEEIAEHMKSDTEKMLSESPNEKKSKQSYLDIWNHIFEDNGEMRAIRCYSSKSEHKKIKAIKTKIKKVNTQIRDTNLLCENDLQNILTKNPDIQDDIKQSISNTIDNFESPRSRLDTLFLTKFCEKAIDRNLEVIANPANEELNRSFVALLNTRGIISSLPESILRTLITNDEAFNCLSSSNNFLYAITQKNLLQELSPEQLKKILENTKNEIDYLELKYMMNKLNDPIKYTILIDKIKDRIPYIIKNNTELKSLIYELEGNDNLDKITKVKIIADQNIEFQHRFRYPSLRVAADIVQMFVFPIGIAHYVWCNWCKQNNNQQKEGHNIPPRKRQWCFSLAKTTRENTLNSYKELETKGADQ